MDEGALGKKYKNGEILIKQGEPGDCMFMIQSGDVEVISENDGKETIIARRGKGDFVGEMALFSEEVRSATVRASGKVKAITVDKRNLLANIQKNPTLAFKIIEAMSRRIRELSDELAEQKAEYHQ
jgi:CRP-like cAMP-binding protein